MKCPICTQEVPTDAIFCHKCRNQIVCKDCGKPIMVGAVICNYCGVSIHNNQSKESTNKIEFREDKDSRSITADFSDSTAEHVVEALSNLFSVGKNQMFTPSNRQIEAASVEEIDVEVQTDKSSNIDTTKNKSEEFSLLKDIFQYRGEELVLHETELKASTKANFTERLTLLFLLFNQLSGNVTTDRNDLNQFLEKYNLYDGNFRTWLSGHKNLINSLNNQLSLSRVGKDKAKGYLTDIFDESKKGLWSTGSSSKNGGKKSKNTTLSSPGKNNKNTNRTYSNLGNLNFNPKGKESLLEFLSKNKSDETRMSSLRYNLLFVYYLEKILEEKNIGLDHVNTCYRHAKVVVPKNLYQSIIDTKSRYGWINTTEMNDLKVNVSGENAVIHGFENK